MVHEGVSLYRGCTTKRELGTMGTSFLESRRACFLCPTFQPIFVHPFRFRLTSGATIPIKVSLHGEIETSLIIPSLLCKSFVLLLLLLLSFFNLKPPRHYPRFSFTINVRYIYIKFMMNLFWRKGIDLKNSLILELLHYTCRTNFKVELLDRKEYSFGRNRFFFYYQKNSIHIS